MEITNDTLLVMHRALLVRIILCYAKLSNVAESNQLIIFCGIEVLSVKVLYYI